MWMLVPGVGEQGGDMNTALQAGARADGKGVLVNVSRGIIYGEDPQKLAKKYSEGV